MHSWSFSPLDRKLIWDPSCGCMSLNPVFMCYICQILWSILILSSYLYINLWAPQIISGGFMYSLCVWLFSFFGSEKTEGRHAQEHFKKEWAAVHLIIYIVVCLFPFIFLEDMQYLHLSFAHAQSLWRECVLLCTQVDILLFFMYNKSIFRSKLSWWF